MSYSAHPEQDSPPPSRELQDYLDHLLSDVPEWSRDEPVESERNHATVTLLAQAVEARAAALRRPYAEPEARHLPRRLPPIAAPASIDPEPAVEEVAPVTTVAEQPLIEEPADTPESVAPPAVEPPEIKSSPEAATQRLGRPQWGDAPFEVLLFRVGGLTLAVPLMSLGAILPWEEGPKHLFGQADWFLGLMPGKQGNLNVVDTARVVMPERYNDSMRESYRYIISLHGSDWGLAVDAIDTAKTLYPEQVRWRSERSKRPWLAGTVVEHMCALLDVAELYAQFHQRKQRPGRVPGL